MKEKILQRHYNKGMKLTIKDKIIQHYEIIALTILMAIGAFLRLFRVDYKGLWFDEIGQVAMASANSISNVIAGSNTHLAPPLDYIILHLFIKLGGSSDFVVRMPSVIWGILAIPLLYYFARYMFNKKVAFVATFLLTISPMHIWYSQEARMYSLFMFLSLLSLTFFILAIEKKKTYFWIGFIISMVLNLYTHYFAIFTLMTFMLLAFIYSKNKEYRSKSILLSVMIAGTLFLPQWQTFIDITNGMTSVLSYGLPANLYLFFGEIFFIMATWDYVGAIAFVVFCLIGMYAIYKYDNPNKLLLLVMWIGVPLILSFMLTLTRGEMTTSRNMIFLLPVYLILVAIGIIALSEFIEQELISKISSKAESIISSKRSLNIFSYMAMGIIVVTGFIEEKIKPNMYKGTVLVVLLMAVVAFSTTGMYSLYFIQNKGERDTSEYLLEITDKNDLIVIFGHTVSDVEYYYKGEADIVYIPKTYEAMQTLMSNSSTKNYTNVYVTYGVIDSGMRRGLNNPLTMWLNNNCGEAINKLDEYPNKTATFRCIPEK